MLLRAFWELGRSEYDSHFARGIMGIPKLPGRFGNAYRKLNPVLLPTSPWGSMRIVPFESRIHYANRITHIFTPYTDTTLYYSKPSDGITVWIYRLYIGSTI